MEKYIDHGIAACSVFLIGAVGAIWFAFFMCALVEIIASWI